MAQKQISGWVSRRRPLASGVLCRKSSTSLILGAMPQACREIFRPQICWLIRHASAYVRAESVSRHGGEKTLLCLSGFKASRAAFSHSLVVPFPEIKPMGISINITRAPVAAYHKALMVLWISYSQVLSALMDTANQPALHPSTPMYRPTVIVCLLFFR